LAEVSRFKSPLLGTHWPVDLCLGLCLNHHMKRMKSQNDLHCSCWGCLLHCYCSALLMFVYILIQKFDNVRKKPVEETMYIMQWFGEGGKLVFFFIIIYLFSMFHYIVILHAAGSLCCKYFRNINYDRETTLKEGGMNKS
jgi:hypothetical protein